MSAGSISYFHITKSRQHRCFLLFNIKFPWFTMSKYKKGNDKKLATNYRHRLGTRWITALISLRLHHTQSRAQYLTNLNQNGCKCHRMKKRQKQPCLFPTTCKSKCWFQGLVIAYAWQKSIFLGSRKVMQQNPFVVECSSYHHCIALWIYCCLSWPDHMGNVR